MVVMYVDRETIGAKRRERLAEIWAREGSPGALVSTGERKMV